MTDRQLRRLVVLLTGTAMLSLISSAALILRLRAVGGASTLPGTALGGRPAPDFSLKNQFGEPVSLSELRGKVIALGFLYTSCPNTCPLIAQNLARVRRELGERAGEAAFVVVSVDPERDSVDRVPEYLVRQGLEDDLTYLTGDAGELRKVWADYYIGVQKLTVGGAPGGYEVAHAESLYLIDKAGRQRSLVNEEIASEELLRVVEVLLRE